MTAEEFYDKNEDKQGKWSGIEWMEQYAKQENYKLLEKISIFIQKLKDEEERNMGSDKEL